ncbi:MAG: serpin family protein [Verrucomicrobiales bacterium]
MKIRLPRFVLDLQSSLKELLSDLNVKAPFDEASADFSGISEQEQLYITSFIHQAAMEVNEEGAEATAATAAVAATRGFTIVPMIPEFNANRPSCGSPGPEEQYLAVSRTDGQANVSRHSAS